MSPASEPAAEVDAGLSVVLVTASAKEAALAHNVLCRVSRRLRFRRLASLDAALAASSEGIHLLLVQERQFGVGLARLRALVEWAGSALPIVAISDAPASSLAEGYKECGVAAVISLPDARRAGEVLRGVLAAGRARTGDPEQAVDCRSGVGVPSPSAGTDAAPVVDRCLRRADLLSRLKPALGEPLDRGIRMLACIRPDRFSSIERAVGVVESETVLDELAEVLSESARPKDLLGRFAGTSFVVLMERNAADEVEAWALGLCSNIASRSFRIAHKRVPVTCSIGLCEVSGDTAAVERALNEASEACYLARVAGGNRARLGRTTENARRTRSRDAAFADRIRRALRDDRLRLVHAPIVCLNQDMAGMVDTWARIVDVDGNVILPKDFLPVAEEFDLLRQIDRCVIAASLDYCARNPAATAFVRLSRDSLLDESLTGWVATATAAASVNPRRICFQVTENVAMDRLKEATILSRRLTSERFGFAVEHFGIGPNWQELPLSLPMDYAKIDAHFVRNLASERSTLESIVRTARDRGILTIAEQVEDTQTMARLYTLGVDLAQGDYFRPQETIVSETAMLEAVGA